MASSNQNDWSIPWYFCQSSAFKSLVILTGYAKAGHTLIETWPVQQEPSECPSVSGLPPLSHSTGNICFIDFCQKGYVGNFPHQLAAVTCFVWMEDPPPPVKLRGFKKAIFNLKSSCTVMCFSFINEKFKIVTPPNTDTLAVAGHGHRLIHWLFIPLRDSSNEIQEHKSTALIIFCSHDKKKGFHAGYYFTWWRMWQVGQNYVGENSRF